MAKNATAKLSQLRPSHATVPQLLELAKGDTDPVSAFVDGTPASDYTLDERIALLAKSGALIAAEIDRLTRLQKKAVAT